MNIGAATSDTDLLEKLVRQAWPLAGSPERLVVPEPFVKEALVSLGISVPRHAVARDAAAAPAQARSLAEPLVLKAFGPGIVHKTEVGAVRLGLTAKTVEAAATAMGSALAQVPVTAQGFLVEEQATPGVELLVGVVRPDGVGPVALVGLGGTLTEILDDVSARLLPLSREDAAQMLGEFRGGAALAGSRGVPAVDREALIELLLHLAGPEGLVARLGPRLLELECNPVIATPEGALVADARLVLNGAPTTPEADAAFPSTASSHRARSRWRGRRSPTRPSATGLWPPTGRWAGAEACGPSIRPRPRWEEFPPGPPWRTYPKAASTTCRWPCRPPPPSS